MTPVLSTLGVLFTWSAKLSRSSAPRWKLHSTCVSPRGTTADEVPPVPTKYLLYHVRPWSSNTPLFCQSWRVPSHSDLPAHCERADRWIPLPRVPGHYHVSTWIQTSPTVVVREMAENLADCQCLTCGGIDHLCLGMHRVPYRFPQFIPGCLSVTPKSDFGPTLTPTASRR